MDKNFINDIYGYNKLKSRNRIKIEPIKNIYSEYGIVDELELKNNKKKFTGLINFICLIFLSILIMLHTFKKK